MVKNKATVRFSHQAIADYLNTRKMMEGILYEHTPWERILPAYNDQYPGGRVPLQMFWQEMLNVDIGRTLQEGTEFLKSEKIRYYYKCTFWEALGQYESPDEKVIAFILKYWLNPDWKGIIHNSVFFGHTNFVREVVHGGFASAWTEPEALELLQSIAEKDSSFVLESIRPYAFICENTDMKLYDVLPRVADETSAEMFDFRMQMVEHYPQLGRDCFRFYDLPQNYPDRALRYLRFRFEHMDDEHQGSIDDKFLAVANCNPKSVVETFVPLIVERSIKDGVQGTVEYQWGENISIAPTKRFFVNLVEKALLQWAKTDIDNALEFIEGHNNPQSPIENEWILKLLTALPPDKNQIVYSWMIKDFPEHLFDYTSKKRYKTDYACELLKQFSCLWPDEMLAQFENLVVNYREPSELEQAQRRFETAKRERLKCDGVPIYWSYWGDLQETILPCLDKDRLNPKTRELLAVLKRRSDIFCGKGHYWKTYCGEAHFITSPVDDHLNRLSDAAWIELIRTNDTKKSSTRNRWREDHTESTPWEFANSFQRAMKAEPKRFLKIVDAIPAHVDEHYISTILRTLSEQEVFEQVKLDGAIQIVEKFMGEVGAGSDMETTKAFCWLIREHADIDWPIHFYLMLSHIAQHHENPHKEEWTCTSGDDKECITVSSLQLNAINCVRGTAYVSIAQIMWKHPSTCELFLETVKRGTEDENPAVRYSVADCLAPLSHNDKEIADDCFMKLLNQDVRILAHGNAPHFLQRCYPKYRTECDTWIENGFVSEDKELAESAAISMAALYVYQGGCEKELFRNTYNEPQTEGLSKQLGGCLTSEEWHEQAKRALLHVLTHCNAVPRWLMRQYLDEENAHPVDLDVLMEVVTQATSFQDCWIAFEFFLKISNYMLYEYREIAFTFCKTICLKREKLYSHRDNLSKLLLKFLDFPDSNENESARYLDLFDQAFQSNILCMNDLLRETQK